MQVRLLGPVDLVDGGRTVPLGGTKERTVLAVLAIHAGQVVSERALIDALWPDAPPRTAVKTLQNYVLRLRKALAGSGSDASECARLTIETRPPGYVLVGAPESLDTGRLAAMVAQARRGVEAGDHQGAARLFDQALLLWRGRSLDEFSECPFARPEAVRLDELRLGLTEDRVDCELALGHHDHCVAQLEAMVAATPLQERMWAQLMLALYRSGRQADALRAYQRARTNLVEELGIEPGPALRRLERDIIDQAPTLDVGPAIPPPPEPEPAPGPVIRTFLFTDIEGSTERWERAPAAMRAALDRHDTIVRDAVATHHGTVFKSVGDALHAAFESPAAGVRAALAAQRELQAQDWTGVGDLAVRMALYTGEAEPVGDDWLGRPLNRCSRLLAAGSGGQVLVSLSTAELVADDVDAGTVLIDLGEHRMRGLARVEQVYQLLAPGLPQVFAPLASLGPESEEPSLPLPPALVGDEDDLFVGRRAEMEVLEAAWDRAVANKRQVVFISGEPGIGKTSLARRLAVHAHAEGALVLYGRCDEGPGLPYQPFVEALQWYVAECPSPRLRTQLGPLGAELARLVPTLPFRLPNLPEPLRAEPETERYRLFEAVAGLLATLSGGAPLLVLLEDLHWAAKPTLLLLRHVLRANAQSRLMVVGTYRDTEVDQAHPLSETAANLRRESGVERISLVGLQQREGTELVAAALGSQLGPTSLRVARSLHSQTGGNPFFLVELVRYLGEIGALSADEGRRNGQLADQLARGGVTDELAVPQGARDVIWRRLSRLSPPAMRALSVAAVVGPSFTLGLMRRIPEAYDDEHLLLDALDEAVATKVVVESRKRPGDYAFVHALMRQVLYDELGSARRARLHHRVGEVLETLPGVEQSHLGALAHHFAEGAAAGTLGKAGQYALRAGCGALNQLAFEEAVVHLTRGVAVLELDYPPDLDLRFELLMALADAHKRSGDVAASKAAAERAAADARSLASPERLARAAAARTGHGTAGLADPVAIALCEDALAMLGDDHPALRGQVLAGLAFQQALGEGLGVRVDHLAAEAVALAREADDTETLHAALFVRAVTLTGSPRVAERLAVAEELVSLADRINDVRVQARGLRVRALAHLELGDLAGFNADRDRLEQLGTDLHSAVYLGDAAQWRVLQAHLAGRFAEVEGLVSETLAVAGSDPNYVNASVGQLFFLHRDQGRLAEVRTMVADAADRNPGLIVLRAVLALANLEAGDPAAARRDLEALMADDFAVVPRDFAWMATISLLAETSALLGDVASAAALYDALEPHAGHTVVVGWGVVCTGSVDRYLGELATTLGRWDLAGSHLERALATAEHLGSAPLAVRTQAALARMLLARDRPGDAARAGELLATTLAVAEELGMAGVAHALASLIAGPPPLANR